MHLAVHSSGINSGLNTEEIDSLFAQPLGARVMLQCIQTIDAGGEVDSMLLSGKMLIVGLHCSPEEGMVRAWHIDLGTDLVLPGRHRVSSVIQQACRDKRGHC